MGFFLSTGLGPFHAFAAAFLGAWVFLAVTSRNDDNPGFLKTFALTLSKTEAFCCGLLAIASSLYLGVEPLWRRFINFRQFPILGAEYAIYSMVETTVVKFTSILLILGGMAIIFVLVPLYSFFATRCHLAKVRGLPARRLSLWTKRILGVIIFAFIFVVFLAIFFASFDVAYQSFSVDAWHEAWKKDGTLERWEYGGPGLLPKKIPHPPFTWLPKLLA